MLPSKHRLPRQEFPLLLHHGKKIYTPEFTLIYSGSINLTPRVGIIVSSKISKSAVTRNQIKRRLRPAIMASLNHLNTSLDIILIAKTPILNQNTINLTQQLQQTFSKL